MSRKQMKLRAMRQALTWLNAKEETKEDIQLASDQKNIKVDGREG